MVKLAPPEILVMLLVIVPVQKQKVTRHGKGGVATMLWVVWFIINHKLF